ncbi:conserved hypothetical protein [Stutzerimonas stutzeri A1501]|uniref:Uncharacterized protein n=1 Tax=Stutzerimonas stutzeri (strain A1501) TaxID=379731 RepID=A4VLP6_STUS1|nr:conserved hypothetical protein [Stutzerimonas stutzeri A1501]
MASLVHPEIRMLDRHGHCSGLFSGSDLFDLFGQLFHERFPRLRSGVAIDSTKHSARGNSLPLSYRLTRRGFVSPQSRRTSTRPT